MELTAFYQKTKTRADGRVAYQGDDALPYVGDNLFIIADGMGGGAALRHSTFDPRLFDEEQTVDALFKGVLDDCGDPRFTDYVKKAFFELRDNKDFYFEDIQFRRKSAFFGSRIVTAIILNLALRGVAFFNDAFAEARSNPGGIAHLQEVLSRAVTDCVLRSLRAAAKNVHLVNESSIAKVCLLGTTLCATIFREEADGVDTLYLTAGDSRAYIWSEEEGLRQLIRDDEASDGGVTNYVCCNEDARTVIRCRYFRFSKPCVLFNASDGVFEEAPSFRLSPLSFERELLKCVTASGDTDGLSRALEEMIGRNINKDDSGTIAMKIFGYDSYEDFSAAASRRAETLERDYFAEMPDLMNDFKQELDRMIRSGRSDLDELKPRFAALPCVRAYCAEKLRSGARSDYSAALEELERSQKEQEEERERLFRRAESVLEQNFYTVLTFLSARKRTYYIRDLDKLASLSGEIERLENEYADMLEEHREAFGEAAEKIGGLLEALSARGDAIFRDGLEGLDFTALGRSQEQLRGAHDFLKQIYDRRLPTMQKLEELRARLIRSNREAAARDKERFDLCRDYLLSGEWDIEKDPMPIPEGELAVLKDALQAQRETEEKQKMQDAEREKLFEQALRDYLDADFTEIAETVLKDPEAEIPEDLRAEAAERIAFILRGRRELSEKIERQKNILEKYERAYLEYIGGSKR